MYVRKLMWSIELEKEEVGFQNHVQKIMRMLSKNWFKYLQLVHPKNFVHLSASHDFVAMALVAAVAVEQFVVDLAAGGLVVAVNYV